VKKKKNKERISHCKTILHLVIEKEEEERGASGGRESGRARSNLQNETGAPNSTDRIAERRKKERTGRKEQLERGRNGEGGKVLNGCKIRARYAMVNA